MPPSTPPVKFHRIHVSNVPNMRSLDSSTSFTSTTFSMIHITFSALKQLLIGNPHTAFRKFFLLCIFVSSLFTMSSVLVSFHAIALYRGSPVNLCHRTVVSRWFVIPIATMSDTLMSNIVKFLVAFSMQSTTHFQISIGDTSIQPGLCDIWVSDTS